MKISRKQAVIFASACVLAAVAVRVFRPAEPPLEPEPPFSFSDGRLVVAAGSKMLSHLEIVTVGKASEESSELRTVGQIIALSNASGNLSDKRVNWAELDPQWSKTVGLVVGPNDPVGTAYGLTVMAYEYVPRIKVGQPIGIIRYGLKGDSIPGEVSQIVPQPEIVGGADLIFRLTHSEQWFPGATCSVLFFTLKGHPVTIPMTAPIHEGIQEYVWKEEAPGQFTPRPVSIVDEKMDSASVMGLQPGDRIVARGAILLKPLLKSMLVK